MEQTTLTPTRCFVRDLADGQEINEVFVVRAHTRRQRRNGDPFLKLQLGDTSGAVEAVIWDEVDSLAPICPAGAVVRILGRYSVDERYGAAVTVKRMRVAAEHEYDLGDLTEAPPVPYEQMAADLDALVETVQRPHLRALLGPPDRPEHRHRRRLPLRAGGEVLPPGLQARAARALPLGGAGRERAGRRAVPGGARPRPRRDRRAAARHRQDAGVREHQRGDRAHRQRQAAGRDPARLLHGPPRDRADRRLPARTRPRASSTSS